MAAVSGIFLGLTLSDLFGIVTQGVEFRCECLHGGQGSVRVAFLHNELTSDFGGTQAGIEPRRAKLRVGLTLAIDDGFDISEQGGQVIFYALATTGRKGIETPEPALQLMAAFADSHTAPTEFTFCAPLPTYAQFFDGTRHKEPAGTSFQGPGCINKEGLERVGQFHVGTSSL
jgi:hypothetical protein